jgi:hypothetical protein
MECGKLADFNKPLLEKHLRLQVEKVFREHVTNESTDVTLETLSDDEEDSNNN